MRRTLLAARGAGVSAVVTPVQGDLNGMRGCRTWLRGPADPMDLSPRALGPVDPAPWALGPVDWARWALGAAARG